ncbi:hypothetical protein CONPUDRAFT_152916 [Coniophora puteana RWD-64-598 SS2]|uniref:Uncharacterized protein n=1 Tax=Coniophora puteana (strain RWD-64-598) TaxID=741705 RepID=A0A5M3MSF8_CONPW|nr:uncharacterized protein CONPUDRAFT_152916 [Coniophora puteana RWD-64-598 SS2]EIW82030.1 hypothetical protein CONPUDRAFT_152916 [Coniophora puteana RWD-64-598 SS2]
MTTQMNTRASNADKHPGEIHKVLSQQTSSEVALHKKHKKAEQDKKNAAVIRQKEHIATLENKLDKKYAKKFAHAPAAPSRPATASIGRAKHATTVAAAVANDNNNDPADNCDNMARPKASSRPRPKAKKKPGPVSTNVNKDTEAPANVVVKQKPRQKKVTPADEEEIGVDGSDDDEMLIDDDDSPAPKPVVRKRVRKDAAKKASTKADKSNEGEDISEPEEITKVVRRSVAERATFRADVDKRRMVQVENNAAAVTAGKGKPDASTVRSIGFKTDIKKWSVAIAPHGPPASDSNTSRSHSVLTSAKSSTLAAQSTTSKRKQKVPEPEPESATEDNEDFGLLDNNAEDLARERASLRANTGAEEASTDVVLLSSPPPSPPLLPCHHLPREHLSSVEEIATPPEHRFSTPENIPSPDEHHEVLSLKRCRADSTKEGDRNEEELRGQDHDQEDEQDEDIALDSEPESAPVAKSKSRTTDMCDVDIQPAKRLKPASGKAIISKTAKGDKDKKVDSGKDDTTGKRKKKHNTNTLPSHAHKNRRWALIFLLTFLTWLARQKDVWGPSNNKILTALQNIWRAVYNKELPLEQDAIDGAVFTLCKQRATKWCSNFGSTASAVLSLSFAAEEMYAYDDVDANRVEYASGLLIANTFMFENVPEDGSQPSGNFRGPLYAATLATHHAAIRGRVKVPEYDNEECYAPCSAMTLACATAEHACQLAADGQLGDLESVVDNLIAYQASGKQSCPIKKSSTALANFSEANWKWATDLYWAGIASMDDGYLANTFRATGAHTNGGEDKAMDGVALADPRAKLPQNCTSLILLSLLPY